ncbi:MAG: hypothetical protein AAGA66_13775 [Bacteroidota bacterium]
MSQNKENKEVWTWVVLILLFPTLYVALRVEGNTKEYAQSFALGATVLFGVYFTLNTSIAHLLEVYFGKESELKIRSLFMKLSIAISLMIASYCFFGPQGMYLLILLATFIVCITVRRLIHHWWKNTRSPDE